MTRIELQTEIDAEKDVCFDLSRSIDVHQYTMKDADEIPVDGRLEGLINQGEWVKWRATHFGISFTMTVSIAEMIKYNSFRDEMKKGPFKCMTHLHTFEKENGKTIMCDVFEYDVPFGIVGKIFDRFLLKKHMIHLLELRNRIIKEVAESGQAKKFFRYV